MLVLKTELTLMSFQPFSNLPWGTDKLKYIFKEFGIKYSSSFWNLRCVHGVP